METHISICGFNFYIVWGGSGNPEVGEDQRGMKWINRKHPIPADEILMNTILDSFNKIQSYRNKNDAEREDSQTLAP